MDLQTNQQLGEDENRGQSSRKQAKTSQNQTIAWGSFKNHVFHADIYSMKNWSTSDWDVVIEAGAGMKTIVGEKANIISAHTSAAHSPVTVGPKCKVPGWTTRTVDYDPGKR